MDAIRIIEVGPRDGLQNEKVVISTREKIEFIQGLLDAGLREIEAASFVSPKWVPQMGDAAELWPLLPAGGEFSALVPNLRGLERALELGVDRIAVFTAASEAFTLKNINMTIDQSIQAFSEVVATFRCKGGRFVRGYVSTIIECPFSGHVAPDDVIAVVNRLCELGVDEISLGETIGVATPHEVKALISALRGGCSQAVIDAVVWHFHDTYGTAISNVAVTLEEGFRAYDSSAAGLGGCPYAPGAAGNLATEDLAYFAEREGFKTGVDLVKLAQATAPILETLGKTSTSKAHQAILSRFVSA